MALLLHNFVIGDFCQTHLECQYDVYYQKVTIAPNLFFQSFAEVFIGKLHRNARRKGWCKYHTTLFD